MNRIGRWIALLAIVFFGRTAFRYFLAGAPIGDGSRARNSGFAQAQVAPLLEKVSGGHVASQQMGAVAVGTLVYALVLGYAARALLGDRGFGPRINGLVALLGSWGALLVYVGLIGRRAPEAIGWAIGAAVLGSVVALAIASVVKAFVSGEFNALMTGTPTRSGAALQRLNAISAPKGPSQDRLRAAISRPPR